MQLVQARDGQSQEKIEQVFLPEEQKCIIALNEKLNGKTEKSKIHILQILWLLPLG